MQNRWADNTDAGVRQSGGTPSEEIWAPTNNAEEQEMQHVRAQPQCEPSDFEICATDTGY